MMTPSFKTFRTTSIVVAAGDRVRIDASLQPGAVDESVEVVATPIALQTDNTAVGATITEKSLVDAPLNGRNFLTLVQVQAGVNAGAPGGEANGGQPTDPPPYVLNFGEWSERGLQQQSGRWARQQQPSFRLDRASPLR